jgi:hypothetical protein
MPRKLLVSRFKVWRRRERGFRPSTVEHALFSATIIPLDIVFYHGLSRASVKTATLSTTTATTANVASQATLPDESKQFNSMWSVYIRPSLVFPPPVSMEYLKKAT